MYHQQLQIGQSLDRGCAIISDIGRLKRCRGRRDGFPHIYATPGAHPGDGPMNMRRNGILIRMALSRQMRMTMSHLSQRHKIRRTDFFSECLTTISSTKLKTLDPKITLITRNSTTHTRRESLSNLPVTKSHEPLTRHTTNTKHSSQCVIGIPIYTTASMSPTPSASTAHKQAWCKHPARRSISGRRSAWEKTVKIVLCRKEEAIILWTMGDQSEAVVE